MLLLGVVVECCCWVLLLDVVVECCCWVLLLGVVVGCCCWVLLLGVVAWPLNNPLLPKLNNWASPGADMIVDE